MADPEKLLGKGWSRVIGDELNKKYMKKINKYVRKRDDVVKIFPRPRQIFRAFRETPPSKCKVVIIGQDPYPHQAADGLAFSASGAKDTPASLQNIFEEMERDVGADLPKPSNDLSRWAREGVLLLNTYLTTEKNNPGAHRHIGWDRFTSKAIRFLGRPSANRSRVFMLWGNHAQSFVDKEQPDISPFDHHCLRASHPSPRSAHLSFNGCGHFSEANERLKSEGLEPIRWHTSDTVPA
jgi:uracil-DNA glycosylase